MIFPMLSTSLSALLFDVTLRSLVLFALAGLILFLLRRASAAVRHALWLLTLIGLLCLPVLCVLLPPLPSPELPAMLARFPVTAVVREHGLDAVSVPAAPGKTPHRAAEVFTGNSPATTLPPTGEVARNRQRPVASVSREAAKRSSGTHAPTGKVVAGWAAGVVLVLAQTLLGLAVARRRVARCRIVSEGPLRDAAEEARRILGVMRPILVREGGTASPVAVPMTWGGLPPTVLLPADAAGWPADRLRAVLLHEVAHVRRGDWGAMLLARVTCALYWFHPLVWLAARQMRRESEAACDDLVLSCGVPAPDYAAHLLEVVRSMVSRRSPWPTTVAIVHRPEVADRLRAILTPDRERGTPTRGKLTVAVILCGAVLGPLAALRPAASAQNTPMVPGFVQAAPAPALPPARVASGAPTQGEFTLLAVTRTAKNGFLTPPSSISPKPPAVAPPVMAGGDGTGLWIGVRGGIGFRTLAPPFDGLQDVYPFGPVSLVVNGANDRYSYEWEMKDGSKSVPNELRPYEVFTSYVGAPAGHPAQTFLTLVPCQLARHFRVTAQPLAADGHPLGPQIRLVCQAISPTALFAQVPTGYSDATKQFRITVARQGASGNPAAWQLTDLPASVLNSTQGLSPTVATGYGPLTIRAAAAESPDLSGDSDYLNRMPERFDKSGGDISEPTNVDGHGWTGVPTVRFQLSAHNASDDSLHQEWVVRLNDIAPQWGVPVTASAPTAPLFSFPISTFQNMSPSAGGWEAHDWQIGGAYPGQQHWVRIGGEMARFAYQTETVTFHDAEIVRDPAFGGDRVIWHTPQTQTTPSGVSITVLNGRPGVRDGHGTTPDGPDWRFNQGNAEMLLAWRLPPGAVPTEHAPQVKGALLPKWDSAFPDAAWTAVAVPGQADAQTLPQGGWMARRLSVACAIPPTPLTRHLKTVTLQFTLRGQQETHPFHLLVPVGASFPPGWDPDAAD